MSFIVIALVAGIVFGFVTGGRLANVGRRRLELIWLLVVSVGLQVAADLLDVPNRAGLAMVLVSYVGLAAFAIANTRLVGMPVVLVGLLCNLAVITFNGGMPVDEDALVSSQAATPAELDNLDLGAKRHLATDDDELRPLGDVIPVRPSREVVSFGDLIMAFGIANVVFRLLKPPASRRRVEDEDDDDVLVLDPPLASRPAPRQLVDA